jgi:hypothetical protein
MNNIFKKVLSTVEEFANKPNWLSLVADSILERIVPKSTAYAATPGWCYEWVRSSGCYCVIMYQVQGRTWTYRRRYCRMYCQSYCDPWETVYTECRSCNS